GGLGPTADDVTAEVVADFAGSQLVLDEALERQIADIVSGFRGTASFDEEALRAANRKQAMVPRGAQLVAPAGTAPGLVLRVADGPTLVALPGPPRELQAMWPAVLTESATQAVLAKARPYQSARLRLFGLPESEIAATLRQVGGTLDLTQLEITTCARYAELVIDIRHRGADAIQAALVAEIVARHGPFVFSPHGSSIDEQLAELLDGHRIAVGESCTGGLLAARLTERPGSSGYFVGGAVVYSNEAKSRLLAVPADLIVRHGAVSGEVAQALADGARARFDADIGVGITGVAGPAGGTEAKPVGYVCICATTAGDAVLAIDPVFPGNRFEVRQRATVRAMHLVTQILQPRN
ncbi:MAG: nicotinamide-nucleotide amidohydrolase family protein, partial [Pseudonocardiaceae bacterium]